MPANEFLRRNSDSSEPEVTPFSGDVNAELKEKYKEIKGTKKAILLGADLSVLKVISSSEIVPVLNRSRNQIKALVIDGIATKQVIHASEERGVSYIAANNFAAVETNIELIGL
jgi:hypothetical protein